MYVILFDGVCNLCKGLVRFITRRDKQALFRFVAIQSGVGQALIKQYAPTGADNRSICYIRNGKCYRKSAAVLHILKDLGGVWKVFYPLILVPACIRDAVYLLIARYRYKLFGKSPSCTLPDRD